MKEEFIRIKSIDNIELCGILYSPLEISNKTVIHVHGLAGNFYENSIISYLAKMYTNNGYNFLTFNNRGHDYFCDLRKIGEKITFIQGGSAYEKFSESIYDIEGVIDYLKNNGTKEIILQGHSYGCNKVIHYYGMKKDLMIKRIILLAPCDIVNDFKQSVLDKYEEIINYSKKLISDGKGNTILDSPQFPLTFTASTVINDFMSDVPGDIFRYRLDNYISDILNNIDIPILIKIGSRDNFIIDRERVGKYFELNLRDYKIQYIEGAPHSFLNKEEILSHDIENWINN